MLIEDAPGSYVKLCAEDCAAPDCVGFGFVTMSPGSERRSSRPRAPADPLIIWESAMKPIVFALLCGAAPVAGGPAFAGPDDAAWVARCVSDNKDEKATVEVITKYCTCMNSKMSDNETLSITAWEKTHATERTACDKEAGWR